MGIGMSELLIMLVIVILIFGTQRLRGMGGDLGDAIKNFRKAIKDDSQNDPAAKTDKSLPEGEVPGKNQDHEKDAG
ncbi:MAG: twin-arginine translocase TatA/TatE family subunit [Methylomonas sp.]|nr:twin-arginine translocase TatA/TatE family subunit [Methylomonas sp.]PPD22627.1 MAG: twin-arginine translocase TatA/TatE family subunit [Methylomonas sp.]PPD27939.1 MAG: twin-arginine translocase TatA/TatE family subunit [Methylomonas sp.]PPD40048.1 MAG: twin-arginine translocase TatA/TatE family subunit [Methylomonas sp.]PPD41564.1 MAG: twin-arginine translocase TatA/TatE family subunit [Methylomonas sp.]